MLNPDSFILIHSWMVTELHLKGTDLLLFALIHGFSNDGISTYTGSLSHMMEWTGCTKAAVLRSLKKLVESGLIRKDIYTEHSFRRCSYSVNWLGVRYTRGIG